MIANNSSGPRSVKYGLTSDFLQELAVYKPDARLIYLRQLPLGTEKAVEFFNENPEYQKVYRLLIDNAALIKERWPRLKKNSAGYNLLQVVNDFDRGIFNLPALIAGSEGTLAVVASATLRLLPLPTDNLTIRLYFKSLIDAGQAVDSLLELKPSGLEIVDGATLDLIGRRKHKIPEAAVALLLLEFDDDVERKRERFMDLAERLDLAGPVDFAYDAETAAPLWKARKAIVPTLYRHHPTKRPISLVEDVSLPPEQIPPFIEYITNLFNENNLTFGVFGHIGDGNLHLRPLFDLNNHNDFELARKLYDEIYAEVIALGGSTTAEHADGHLRAGLVRKLYGDEIYGIFLKIKNWLDPDGLLSPGSILSERAFTEHIDYEKIKSYCAACGKCNGYCPAFDYFRREDLSPRGWLRIINQSNASRRKKDDYLKYCLNCKNCTTVCPAGVDIAAEIMKYRAEKTTPFSRAVVSAIDNNALLGLTLRLGKLFEPVTESAFGRNLMAAIGKKRFGIDKTLRLPKIAATPLRKKYKDRLADSGRVGLFYGCADNLLESRFGEAFFKVCDLLGIDAKIPEQKCCGLPYEVYGHRDNLKAKAGFNVDHLLSFDSIVTGCASCLLRLKEYPGLFEPDSEYHKKAEELRRKCYDVSQFLNYIDIDVTAFKEGELINLSYHNPCHLRAAGLHEEPEKLIGKLNNIRLIHPRYGDRCCAQAGSYGFTHFAKAKEMFAKKRDDYYRLGAEYIMSSCPACRMKIEAELGGNFKVVHPVEILAKRVNGR
jgi:Fe-S oxidoreductase/FAD/FMN-containing dehydrogenase